MSDILRSIIFFIVVIGLAFLFLNLLPYIIIIGIIIWVCFKLYKYFKIKDIGKKQNVNKKEAFKKEDSFEEMKNEAVDVDYTEIKK
ncbi:MAG: hypothetical protein ACERKV_03340 [Clostridiaceae bacterium]